MPWDSWILLLSEMVAALLNCLNATQMLKNNAKPHRVFKHISHPRINCIIPLKYKILNFEHNIHRDNKTKNPDLNNEQVSKLGIYLI